MTASTTMTVAAMSTTVVIAVLLLRAGIQKLTDPTAAASTVAALGIPGKWSDHTARLVALSEAIVAFGVLFAPGSHWTLIGVAALGAAFAFAGLVAMLRRARIRCHCLGSGAAGPYLGVVQLLALPLWVGAALLLRCGLPEIPHLATGALLLAAAGLAMAASKAPALLQAVRDARGDRATAQEMYLWLPRR